MLERTTLSVKYTGLHLIFLLIVWFPKPRIYYFVVPMHNPVSYLGPRFPCPAGDTPPNKSNCPTCFAPFSRPWTTAALPLAYCS